MKLKYRNFKRLSDAGPIHGGFEATLILGFVAAILLALAYYFKDTPLFVAVLLVPALACLYGVGVELKSMFTAHGGEKED